MLIMRIQIKLLKNHVKLLIKLYKTSSVIFGSSSSIEKSRREKNLNTIDIDKIRKRERVCKNCQICIDKDFENKVTQFSILLKTGSYSRYS